MLPIERFNEWNPRYREEMAEPESQEVYRFLSSPHSIWAMAKVSEDGKPALTGVVKELESKFTGSFDFDNPMNRRMVGSMIKEIIHDFGFRRKGQRLVSNTDYFTTASYYELEEEKAIQRITGLFEVQNQEGGEGLATPKTHFESIAGKEQIKIKSIQPTKPGHKELLVDKQIANIIARLASTLNDENSTEQEIGAASGKLFAIATTALSSLSGLFNTKSSGQLPISMPAPCSNDLKATYAAAEKLRLSGEAEFNSMEASLILEELLKEQKDNEELSIEKTGSTYKLTLRSKGV